MATNQKKIGIIISYINILANNLIILFYIPFLLRNLGQEDFGLYQLINTVISTLSLLSMGFSSAYIPFYTRYKEADDKDGMKSLNGLYLLLFTGMSVVAIIIGSVMIQNSTALLPELANQTQVQLAKVLMTFMIINIALSFPASVFESNIIAQEQFRFNQSLRLLILIVKPIIVIPLILLGMNAVAIVIVQTLLGVVTLISNASFAICKLEMKFQFKSFPKAVFKEVAIFSSFIMLGKIIGLANNSIPNFIIGGSLGFREVTTYAMTLKIKRIFSQLSFTISKVFVPELNRMVVNQGNMTQLTNLMIKVGRLQFAILTFMFGGFITTGRFFVSSWAGDENSMIYPLLIIICAINLIPWCQMLGGDIQKAMNKHRFRSVVSFILAVVNIILTYILVNTIGIIGAVIAFAITILIGHGILNNYYYHRLGLDILLFWKKMLNILIPFFASTAFSLLIQQWVEVSNFWLFLLFGLLYTIIFLIVYLRYAANNEEKQQIRQLQQSMKRLLTRSA